MIGLHLATTCVCAVPNFFGARVDRDAGHRLDVQHLHELDRSLFQLLHLRLITNELGLQAHALLVAPQDHGVLVFNFLLLLMKQGSKRALVSNGRVLQLECRRAELSQLVLVRFEALLALDTEGGSKQYETTEQWQNEWWGGAPCPTPWPAPQ